MLAAFAGFYGVCERMLAEAGAAEESRPALAAARQQFLAALGSEATWTDVLAREEGA